MIYRGYASTFHKRCYLTQNINQIVHDPKTPLSGFASLRTFRVTPNIGEVNESTKWLQIDDGSDLFTVETIPVSHFLIMTNDKAKNGSKKMTVAPISTKRSQALP